MSSQTDTFFVYDSVHGTLNRSEMNVRDGGRYVTTYLNQLLNGDLMNEYSIGPERNKSRTPIEFMVKWNLQNPLMRYYKQSRK